MNTKATKFTSWEGASLPIDASTQAIRDSFIVQSDDCILITGAAGFIGCHVVESLVNLGFRNLLCFAKPSSDLASIEAIIERRSPGTRIEIIRGNLLSRVDCEAACKDAKVILHLAAGTGEKSFPDAFMNSVVTTRNLLDATLCNVRLQRFVLVSSFSVYTNRQKSWRLDESCPIEEHPERRRDAYCYAKVKQEQMVSEYAKNYGVPSVVVRLGSVYGEGASGVTGRVGLGTFGLFLHLGGSNIIPFTYVENCADAIVLAGIVKGVDGEIFNVVDDDLPSSRHFLRQYKKNVKRFKSVYVPHVVSHGLCCLWEAYSRWSVGQLPLAFTQNRWYSEWRRTNYSNKKLKCQLGWAPKVSTEEGLRRYFQGCREGGRHA
jgi:nucleoside-diphosphate-sugar epimerase